MRKIIFAVIYLVLLAGFWGFLSAVGAKQAAAQEAASQPAPPPTPPQYEPVYVKNSEQLVAYIDPSHLFEIISRHQDRNVLIVVKDGDKWLVVFGPQR